MSHSKAAMRLMSVGVATLVLLVSQNCDDGVPSGPPPCVDQGIRANVRISPDASSCNTSNTVTVTVENNSCSAVQATNIAVEAAVQSGSCFGFADDFSVDQRVPSKAQVEFVLDPLPWCCGAGAGCCGSAPCSEGTCGYQMDVVVTTSAGDISGSGNDFTKSFGSGCTSCSSPGSGTDSWDRQ